MMETILVWLLVNVGSAAHNGQPTVVLAQFAANDECQRVALVIQEARDRFPPLIRCVEARIVKP